MTFDKDNPFLATITQREVLNKPSSHKCTVHLSLDISGSDYQYKVGDSIGVYPKNSHIIVQEVLNIFKIDPQAAITDPRNQIMMSAFDFLTSRANLSKVTKKWIEHIARHTHDHHDNEALHQLLQPENKQQLKDFCEQRQLWDFLKEFSHSDLKFESSLPVFAPLLPRFYSIASSQQKHPEQIDLLIAYFKYMTNKHLRHGVASHYLCEMAQMHTPEVATYIHPSRGFTLPEDPLTPIIMIGPGTGIAPYRGFMQERARTKNAAKNWLFFGDWNQETDYYYESEWKEYEKQGILKTSLAFSRDQDHKIYVQHKMFEQAETFWEWLEQDAVVYVCGDAKKMAKDVDLALHQIIEEQGNLTPDDAKKYVKQMKETKRYLRDVY